MKGRHLHIESDAKLWIEIRRSVQAELNTEDPYFRHKLLLKLGVYGGLFVVFYSLLYLLESPLWIMVDYVLLGLTILLLAFNFAHDLSHNTVFGSKRWNSLGYIFMFTLVGAHAESWRERHVRDHHFAPNVKAYDTDLQITNLIRVDPGMEHRWFHRFQHLYAPIAYCTYSLYWMLIKDVKVLWLTIRRDGLNMVYLLSFIAQKAVYLMYILVLPLLLSGHSAGTVILGFVLMHLVQSIFLLFTFFMTHHVMETAYPGVDDKGVIQASWLMNQIRSSNDMHPFSEVANFMLGGFNNHVAHHLFPNVHHIYYPRLNRILYRVLENHGVRPNQTTYLGGVISHLKLLKKMSTPKTLTTCGIGG